MATNNNFTKLKIILLFIVVFDNNLVISYSNDSLFSEDGINIQRDESKKILLQNIDEINTDGNRGTPTCRLYSPDPYIYNKIQEILSYRVKLLEYDLQFEDYNINPLTVNCSWTYQGNKWARAYSQHGQTLLSLAFNYGVMSLMTLTLGVENMQISLKDNPKGCAISLTENERISAVMYLLMRDFKTDSSNITLKDQERICHEVVIKMGKFAKFTDRCCHIDAITKKLTCTTDIINIWLKILFFCLSSVKFGLLLFGPILFIPFVESIANQYFPYVVKLKDPLVKTIFLCDSKTHVSKTYDKVVDLRGKKGFEKMKQSMKNVPIGEPVKVQFTRYDIMVKYSRLLIENNVPVGLIGSFIDAIFKCKLSQIGPFVECCQTNICSVLPTDKEVTWKKLCRLLVKIMLFLLLPFPFYFRLVVFYVFEADDINERHKILSSMGLISEYDGAILTYLTPTHPFLITVYVLYFISAITIGFLIGEKRNARLQKTIVGSFRDLRHLSWTNALGVFTGNMIWPFKRCGIIGCVVAPAYWFIFFPFSILIYSFYCLPSIYVAFRMLVHSPDKIEKVRKATGMYRIDKDIDNSMYNFQTETMLESLHSSLSSDEKTQSKCCINVGKIQNILLSLLCVVTMYGVLLLMSECVGFIVELLVFTLMGIIVNAGAVLKYVTLLILVIVYSYDCYNNVGKKYLKLNKTLFNELKSRCKEIEKVTSLPSHLQENYGFKSQELSEQADYEESDDIDGIKHLHWMINDLVLFVDNEDMPRIPRNLFEEVCGINVAGAPGPVYQSLIEATKDFVKILVFIFFVFVVVLTFGEVYKVSSTNQMLATLAGGFMPFLMRTFLTPSKPDIELGTVSFKSKLDEIIKNFNQTWPIYDFPFEVCEIDDESGHGDEDGASVTSSMESDQRKKLKYKEKLQNEVIIMEHREMMMPDSEKQDYDNANNNNSEYETIDYCNSSAESDKEKSGYDVDILVYLPNAKVKDKWLDQWSDYDAYSEMNEDDLEFTHLNSSTGKHYTENIV